MDFHEQRGGVSAASDARPLPSPRRLNPIAEGADSAFFSAARSIGELIAEAAELATRLSPGLLHDLRPVSDLFVQNSCWLPPTGSNPSPISRSLTSCAAENSSDFVVKSLDHLFRAPVGKKRPTQV